MLCIVEVFFLFKKKSFWVEPELETPSNFCSGSISGSISGSAIYILHAFKISDPPVWSFFPHVKYKYCCISFHSSAFNGAYWGPEKNCMLYIRWALHGHHMACRVEWFLRKTMGTQQVVIGTQFQNFTLKCCFLTWHSRASEFFLLLSKNRQKLKIVRFLESAPGRNVFFDFLKLKIRRSSKKCFSFDQIDHLGDLIKNFKQFESRIFFCAIVL